MPKIKFNPTGTHIQHGFLKVRVDIYPNPSDKTYTIHYVNKPDRPYTEEELADETLRTLVSTHKELNPCLCHFIKIDLRASRKRLEAKIKEIFDADTLRQLDNILFEGDRSGLALLMKPKSGEGRALHTPDVDRVIKIINKRFARLEIEV